MRVVSPAGFRHYGIAYGDGIVNNLRAAPWKLLALPLFLLSFARAARRASRGRRRRARALASERAARARDGEAVRAAALGLGRRARSPRRAAGAPARTTCARRRLRVDRARRRTRAALGARDVRVIPSGVAIPDRVAEPDEPPHALYVGRLSEEKGVRELAEAAAGLPLVVVGDGPLRSLFPQTVGFVPPGELGPYYERASVVVVPSRREGYGVVAREAMAHGRPVVATAVGGLRRRGRGRRDRPRRAAARAARPARGARATARGRRASATPRCRGPPTSLASASRSRRPPRAGVRLYGELAGRSRLGTRGSPAPSEFPTLAEMLARARARSRLLRRPSWPSSRGSRRRPTSSGAFRRAPSSRSSPRPRSRSRAQGHHAATLAGLTELVRSNVGDVLLVSGEARPTRSERVGADAVAGVATRPARRCRSTSRRALRCRACHLRRVDTPRPGVVLVRRDDLLLAADEADLVLVLRRAVAGRGWGRLVGSVLALLDASGLRPSGIGPASRGRRRRAGLARAASSGRPRRGSSSTEAFSPIHSRGRRCRPWLSSRALVRTGADLAVLRPGEIHPTVGAVPRRARRADPRSRARAGRAAGRRPPDVADLLAPRARRPPRDRRAVRAHPPGHDLGPDTGVPRRRREARLPSRRPPPTLALADHVGFFSLHAARDAASDGGLELDRATVVPLGVDHLADRRRSRLSRPTARRQALPADGRQLVPAQEPGLRVSPPRPARRREAGTEASSSSAGRAGRVVGAGRASLRRTRTRRSTVACARSATSRTPSNSRSTATPSSSSFPRSTKDSGSSRSRRRPSGLRRVYTRRSSMRELLPDGGGASLVRRRRGRGARARPARASRRARADRRRDLGEGGDADLGSDRRRVPGGLRARAARGLQRASVAVLRAARELGDRGAPSAHEALLLDVYRRRRGSRLVVDSTFRLGTAVRRGVRTMRRVGPTRAPSRRGSGRASAGRGGRRAP